MWNRPRGSGNGVEGKPWTWTFYAALLALLLFLKLAEIIALLHFAFQPSCEFNYTSGGLHEPLDRPSLHREPTASTKVSQETSSQKQCFNLQMALQPFREDVCARGGDALPVTCKLCPLHWVPEQEKCYYFSEEKKNWETSRKFCQHRRSDMVSLDDPRKMEFIRNVLATKKGYFWLGLRKEEGTWTWMTGAVMQKESFPIKDDNGMNTCAVSGKDTFSAESCFNPNKLICETNAVEFPDIAVEKTRR